MRAGDLANDVHGLGCYLNITDEGEGSQLKTKNARTREFVFPDLKPDVAGKRSGNWSKWFGRYKRDIGIGDKRKIFHSFRHGFIDACRAAGVQTEARDVLVGHANDSVAAEYEEENYRLPPLFDAIKRVRYPGLELAGLHDRR